MLKYTKKIYGDNFNRIRSLNVIHKLKWLITVSVTGTPSQEASWTRLEFFLHL